MRLQCSHNAASLNLHFLSRRAAQRSEQNWIAISRTTVWVILKPLSSGVELRECRINALQFITVHLQPCSFFSFYVDELPHFNHRSFINVSWGALRGNFLALSFLFIVHNCACESFQVVSPSHPRREHELNSAQECLAIDIVYWRQCLVAKECNPFCQAKPRAGWRGMVKKKRNANRAQRPDDIMRKKFFFCSFGSWSVLACETNTTSDLPFLSHCWFHKAFGILIISPFVYASREKSSLCAFVPSRQMKVLNANRQERMKRKKSLRLVASEAFC